MNYKTLLLVAFSLVFGLSLGAYFTNNYLVERIQHRDNEEIYDSLYSINNIMDVLEFLDYRDNEMQALRLKLKTDFAILKQLNKQLDKQDEERLKVRLAVETQLDEAVTILLNHKPKLLNYKDAGIHGVCRAKRYQLNALKNKRYVRSYNAFNRRLTSAYLDSEEPMKLCEK